MKIGLKRLLLLTIVATTFISFGSFAIAGQGQGVPQHLDDVVAELQNINETLSNTAGENGSKVKGVASAEGLITVFENGPTYDLVDLSGPGTFVAARMVKQGGDSGLTAISLEIDGKVVVQRNVAALKNWGMTQNNPFGVVVFTSGDIDTVTVGFSQPMTFENNLVLRAIVGESGVVQIIGTVIYGQ